MASRVQPYVSDAPDQSLPKSQISKLKTDPLVVSVAIVAFSSGFWAACAHAMSATAAPIVLSPITLAVLGGMNLIVFSAYVYHHRKEIFYETSLLLNLAQHDFCPSRHSWWNKIDDNLYLGAIPLHNSEHLEEIPKAIKKPLAIVSVLESFEIEDRYLLTTVVSHQEWQQRGIPTLHIPAVDLEAVSQANIQKAIRFIHQQIQDGRTVYLHCKAGLGRSASVAACYLLEHGLANGRKFHSAQEAIQYLKTIRMCVSIGRSPGKESIENFARNLRARS